MGTLLSYLVIYIIYIIIILKKKEKTERMLRIVYNVIQNYAEKNGCPIEEAISI